MAKVLVAGGPNYFYPFSHLGEVTDNPNSVDSADLLVLTGGADVSPSMYGHKAHPKTYPQPTRDKIEVDLVKRAVSLSIPVVGICRGAQLLTVIAGGKLIQHCTGHAVSHKITTADGEEFEVTSTHHQMMDPMWGHRGVGSVKHKLLAWADDVSPRKEAQTPEDLVVIHREPEVVKYPDIDALAVQYHPEHMPSDSRGFTYFVELVEDLLK